MFARIHNTVLARIASFSTQDDGQTMAEYGLLLALIAIAVVGAVGLLGGSISAAFTNIQATLQAAL